MFDTILPAAIAALPATVVVDGQTVELVKPDVYYGLPGTENPPRSWVGIAGSTQEDTPVAVFPVAMARPFDEQYALEHRIWYRVGDNDRDGQRIASTSAWTVFRAIVGQCRASTEWKTVLQAPFSALITSVTETEFALTEGRAVGITFNLTIKTRV